MLVVLVVMMVVMMVMMVMMMMRRRMVMVMMVLMILIILIIMLMLIFMRRQEVMIKVMKRVDVTPNKLFSSSVHEHDLIFVLYIACRHLANAADDIRLVCTDPQT